MTNQINTGTTTEDLIATFGNAKPLGSVSFEQGCTVLDAIAEFDARCGGGTLGTWRAVSTRAQLALGFMPKTDSWDDAVSHDRVVEQLAQRVLTWSLSYQNREGDLHSIYIVVDRRTRVVWAECSLLVDRREVHPRPAGEFASSADGFVVGTAMAHLGEGWRELRDDVAEAYHEAKRSLDGEDA